MRAKLKLLRGSQAGKVIELKKENFIIGRADGCHLRPNHEAVSRRHCQFTLYADKVTLQDLGSRNGTYINGEKSSGEVELTTGDELRVGPLKFEVLVTDDQGRVIQPVVPDDRIADPLSDSAGDSGLIGQWLEEADEKAKVRPETGNETRQFQLDETEWQLKQDATDGSTSDTKSFLGRLKKGEKKKLPGKLPAQANDNASANSREAAAETLKKIFNRGTG